MRSSHHGDGENTHEWMIRTESERNSSSHHLDHETGDDCSGESEHFDREIDCERIDRNDPFDWPNRPEGGSGDRCGTDKTRIPDLETLLDTHRGEDDEEADHGDQAGDLGEEDRRYFRSQRCDGVPCAWSRVVVGCEPLRQLGLFPFGVQRMTLL